jgi:hypothetical protein
MIGLLIEVGIRTSVWILSKGCQGVYYLCYGRNQENAERKRKEDLENKIKMLEARIESLEK